MIKSYEEPHVEVINFSVDDVIATSGVNTKPLS